ncbi:hypothetical protein [Hufsiella ginkgonis]|uniref:Uncharacterized protein n=1 Tax=Hufsiella ginkgonis TaxID=2695274 RepID=A0A7K1Y131_9SPHI|nr:hypothetical protein [Hufsiella ginkgonis]MXV16719.1 hypothetical protein [Hufsiella ginkgonis]
MIVVHNSTQENQGSIKKGIKTLKIVYTSFNIGIRVLPFIGTAPGIA